jgi:hypothetical protein
VTSFYRSEENVSQDILWRRKGKNFPLGRGDLLNLRIGGLRNRCERNNEGEISSKPGGCLHIQKFVVSSCMNKNCPRISQRIISEPLKGRRSALSRNSSNSFVVISWVLILFFLRVMPLACSDSKLFWQQVELIKIFMRGNFKQRTDEIFSS